MAKSILKYLVIIGTTNFVKILQLMADDKIIMFRNRLAKQAKHLGKLAKRQQVQCYRLYDHDLPEFPFCIEYYGDKLYVAEYKRRHGLTDEEHAVWLQQSKQAIAETLNLPLENIFLRLRQRKQGRQGQYQRLEEETHEFVVEESALKFIVNLTDYLDTGLFLDHRLTRQMVRDQSKGMKVLNLFAYTGSFSVYAAAGGAEEVVTVDLSKTYLSWAQRNLHLNGFSDHEKYKYQHADVKKYLKELSPNYFDLIVMDPPTFSNSQRMEDILDIQRDHVELINDCLRSMVPGGRLYFSTNFSRFILDEADIKASSIKDMTRATTPFDFEGKLARYCFLIKK
jgi:23S rRNA (cytosine1962-C5)-methyltransferase